MSVDFPAPRFDPRGRGPGHANERRRRVLVLGAAALLVALAGASVANSRRAALRCEDQQLVPYGGRLLPLGEQPLDDSELPPLTVAVGECEDEDFDSRAALRERYRELAASRADAALASEEPSALETSLEALESLDGEGGGLTPRYREVMEALLRVEVERAKQSHHRAWRRLEQAREAGVDADALRAAERELDALTPPSRRAPAPEPPPTEAPAPRPAEPRPPSTPGSRAL